MGQEGVRAREMGVRGVLRREGCNLACTAFLRGLLDLLLASAPERRIGIRWHTLFSSVSLHQCGCPSLSRSPAIWPIAALVSARSEYPPSNTETILPSVCLSANATMSRVYREKNDTGTRRSCRCIAWCSCSHASKPALRLAESVKVQGDQGVYLMSTMVLFGSACVSSIYAFALSRSARYLGYMRS